MASSFSVIDDLFNLGLPYLSTGPGNGPETRNETVYLDIVPDRRIMMAYTMAFDGKNISASLGTVEFEAIGAGTRLIYTEQGAFFDGADGPSSRKQGWNGLLTAPAGRWNTTVRRGAGRNDSRKEARHGDRDSPTLPCRHSLARRASISGGDHLIACVAGDGRPNDLIPR
jgi:Activator of Hsp90 ATPase homolog 1-like protein